MHAGACESSHPAYKAVVGALRAEAAADTFAAIDLAASQTTAQVTSHPVDAGARRVPLDKGAAPLARQCAGR